MKDKEIAKAASVPRWTMWLAMVAWLAVIVVWTTGATSASFELSPQYLRHSALVLAWLRGAAWLAAKQFALHIPLGFLAVLALPPRTAWLDRTARRWLPALAIALALAALVRSVFGRADGPSANVGALGLVIPWAGCLFGTWAAMAWAKGMVARILFFPKVAVLIVLLSGSTWAILRMAIEPAPATIDMPQVTSADRRHLYDVFIGKNPFKLREGTTVTLRLTEHELNLLLAWGLAVQGWPIRAHIEIAGDRGQVVASVPLRGGSKFLNVRLHGSASAHEGKVDLMADRLRIGQVEIPRAILRILSPAVAWAMAGEPHLRPALERVRSVELQTGQLALTYVQGTPAKGFVSKLFHDQASEQVDIPAVHAQIRNLMAAAPRLPRDPEARFGAAMRTAFAFARNQMPPGHAVEANRAAVLALGIALGHVHVETLIGRFMDEPTRSALLRTFDGTTVRKRDDWPKHFFVSAALTIIAARNVSDATGLLKEEKDAAGGSGFSFGDLLADRAGTTFAQAATRDEVSAQALQARLAQGFNTDEFFPKAEDLPEGIQDADFQARYGGVGGKEFNRLTTEIEHRIAGCAAYAPAR